MFDIEHRNKFREMLCLGFVCNTVFGIKYDWWADDILVLKEVAYHLVSNSASILAVNKA